MFSNAVGSMCQSACCVNHLQWLTAANSPDRSVTL